MENFKKLTNTENILFAEELWKSVSKENLELSDAIKQYCYAKFQEKQCRL